MPGTDSAEAARIVAGELDIPHLVELPARGPGGDMLGRTLALVSSATGEFAAETTPDGWRLAGGRSGGDLGRQMRRGVSWLAEDVDRMERRARRVHRPGEGPGDRAVDAGRGRRGGARDPARGRRGGLRGPGRGARGGPGRARGDDRSTDPGGPGRGPGGRARPSDRAGRAHPYAQRSWGAAGSGDPRAGVGAGDGG